ncbi:hypothetical protein ACVNS2_32120 [Paenibacillus caseinilyticus]|uniref:Uncharacterized protein n=1 Tax=Paenibacillus mucilaginosus K02 TaxID=997761 RepID=I0BSL9_9BACL|nr:hypothetical protein [Paenibacillus mucilaginosus]AFH65366.1 hypothetical protein B2K_32455 [Paenibacillus mucilaginosus K02]
MKIALHNERPEEAQLRRLMDDLAVEAGVQPHLEEPVADRSGRVIAAYDCGRLIGVGRLVDTGAEAGSFECTLLPSYSGREIESSMRKLLSARRMCR